MTDMPPPASPDPNLPPIPTAGPAVDPNMPPAAVAYASPSTGGYPGPYVGPAPDKDARTMGMLAHLAALAGLIVPLGNIIGPLVIWLIKKDESPFVNDQGKESLNFQIWATILLVLAAITFCIGIGFVLVPAIGIAMIVMSIIAAVKANEGVAYRYPLTPFRLIK